jgi:exopolysaccharide biosynthesis protein
MSGKSASGIVQSKITARAGTRYFTAMELLYPLKIGNETKYAWFVPIYFESETTKLIGLAGLGIVDAQSPEKVIIEYTGEGITGESLIKKAKQDFKALYGEVKPPLPEFKTIEGKLIAKYEPYVSNGSTRQWLTIETADGKRTDVLVKAELLSDAELLAIQKLQVGDQVRVEVDEGNVVRRVP